MLFHHLLRHFKFLYFLLTGQMVHQIEHQFFQNHAQTPRPHLASHGLARNRPESVLAELQANVLKLKQPLILLDDSVLRPSQDFNQRKLVQVLQYANHWQTTDKLRNQPKLDQVLGLDVAEHLKVALTCYRWLLGFSFFPYFKAERFLARASSDNLFQPDERAAADKQNIGRIHWREFLMRMLAPALRRNVGNRTFKNFQQRLLHSLSGNVARDRGVLILAPDLVYLIDINDAGLRPPHIPICRLQQFENDVLHVLTDVSGLG